MKKILVFLLWFIPLKVFAYSADAMIAMDIDNDYVYYAKDIEETHLIASTSKIMTAIVVIENSDLDSIVEVGDEVLSSYGSAIYIEVGEKLTIRDLLYGLILRSGNDAAEVLAKTVAGSMENFAYLMNEVAIKIGMTNSNFINASGLENEKKVGNTSTALDMAKLTKYAYQNHSFREIFGAKKYTCKSNKKTYSWTSKNKLIHQEDYITGGKTGYTELARRTLVTTASRNNLNVIVVTLNDGNDFLDHKNMYKDVFKKYEALKVVDKNKLDIKDENIYQNDSLYLENDIYVPIKDKNDTIDITYELNNTKYKDKDRVGRVVIKLNDEVVRIEDIYVNVKGRESLRWWQKFLRWLGW